ncbi:dephospho-CoA kinase [Microbacterium sp. zg.Y1090]|uniref:dephospho-CoA kinase n=1 Tax=Microbacterium TaxID=33882 RepID=UPI00214C6A2F|nr:MULTISPECIES: dephospho-CoA kinase [unclassified Microbacterium]MCR2811480.1 dephospho-CoA kinase [Microbacterium sp. zg.Y1084]MCR2819101.1 dephospho-CoA kinase [Microbacterium sp. zg.Y1090]MDL5487900.1 dephospho-CoA kinase [Microbacterium sp. zg-Y1211]WIM27404.1 dephospho-CoA kinase [Microbacterium sp. zg-Y1090]
MPLIALTGGIASGKSTIAQRLAEHGAIVVDADRIVRDVQTPGSPVLDEIAAQFGPDVLGADGSLNRARLASLVFGDDEALARLNAIVHPAVRQESARRFAAAREADPAAVVVYDVPLLVDARADDPWDLIVVAHAPADVRVRRLVELRGMNEADAQARLAAQVPDARRLAIADVVIDTTGTLADTRAQTDDLWRRLAGDGGEAHADTGTHGGDGESR